MDSMDSIDLLHKIAKTPNILGGGGGCGGTGGWMASAVEAEPAPNLNGGHTLAVPPERPPGAASVASSAAQQPRHKLVKQKSLNRTLSTSVLRIKKKRSFWSSA